MKPTIAILFIALTIAGCSRQPAAPHSSLTRKKAEQCALAVSLIGNGSIAIVEPTGSMVPALDHRTIIVYEKCEINDIAIGDIIVRRREDGKSVIHRVVALNKGPITRGDANSSNDIGYVTDSNLIGRVFATVTAND